MHHALALRHDNAPADDIELVVAIAQGDPEALGLLYERYARYMFAIAFRIVGERRDAEDLLHDVLLEAWRTANQFDPKRGNVKTWLAIRMRSRALDLMKSPRKGRDAGDSSLARQRDNREPCSVQHIRVRAALRGLSAEQRLVLNLAYFAGMSCSEIATKLSIPVGTVKSRLAAGLRRMRERLR